MKIIMWKCASCGVQYRSAKEFPECPACEGTHAIVLDVIKPLSQRLKKTENNLKKSLTE